MKKAFTVLLLISLLCAFPICAQAAEVISGGTLDGADITWMLDSDGTLSFSGTGAIPDYAKNAQPWRAHQSSGKNYIKTVVVGEGITRIGDRALQNCSRLTSAVIPASVKTVGKWAFQNCYVLENVEISPGTELDSGSFRSAPAEADIIIRGETVYTGSDFHKRLAAVGLTGKYRTDIVNIALSQIDYHEGDSPADYDGANPSSEDNYTEYGRFLGSEGSDWCSEFYSWCVSMAGVPTNILKTSREAMTDNWISGTNAKYYTWAETVYGGGDYVPQMGDLLQWAWDLDDHTTSEALSHTSMFAGITDNRDGTLTISSIDGNVSNKVRTKKYTVNERKGILVSNEGQLCYIISPAYEQQVTKYRVSFSCEGSTFPSKTVAKNGRYGVLPLPPEREGYRFGWYTAETGGELVNMYTKVKLLADQTLYGRWERIPEASGNLGVLGWAYYGDGSLRLTGDLPDGARVFVASYLDSGKMFGTQIVSATGDLLYFDENCSTVRLMLVNAGGKPMCAAREFFLD